MAGIVHLLDLDVQYRRQFRRNRVIRDRTNPLDVYNDNEVFERYRFSRVRIFELEEDLRVDLEHQSQRNSALSPLFQLLVALRYYASGYFHNFAGDMINIHRTTACRAIRRVSVVLKRKMGQYIYFTRDRHALNATKTKFRNIGGFPGVVGWIDATHIRILINRIML